MAKKEKAPKEKKPIFRRWWFWVIMIPIIVYLALLVYGNIVVDHDEINISGDTTNNDTKIETEIDKNPDENNLTKIATFDSMQAELLGVEQAKTEEGDAIRVRFRFTNNSNAGMYMYESFAVKAFQDGVSLIDITDINDAGESANLIREVKDGASIDCSYVFLANGMSDVNVQVCEPTAYERILVDVIAKMPE